MKLKHEIIKYDINCYLLNASVTKNKHLKQLKYLLSKGFKKFSHYININFDMINIDVISSNLFSFIRV